MEDPVHDLIPKTSKAITEFDLAQRKEWAKARAAALEKWEKSRGVLERKRPGHARGYPTESQRSGRIGSGRAPAGETNRRDREFHRCARDAALK